MQSFSLNATIVFLHVLLWHFDGINRKILKPTRECSNDDLITTKSTVT
jgi:hypothetical protein